MPTSIQVHTYKGIQLQSYKGAPVGGPLVYLSTCVPLYLESL